MLAVFWLATQPSVAIDSPHSVVMQMREKNLCPDDAAQYAQQIMAGRIRISELGAMSSTANQERLVHPCPPCMFVLDMQCSTHDHSAAISA